MKQDDALFVVRGNGLGLTWDSSVAMIPTGDLGTWGLEVRFREAVGGLSCADCEGPGRDVMLQPGEHLQLRVSLTQAPVIVGFLHSILSFHRDDLSIWDFSTIA